MKKLFGGDMKKIFLLSAFAFTVYQPCVQAQPRVQACGDSDPTENGACRQIAKQFVPVTGEHSLFSTVKKAFQDVIFPIYGDQTKALGQIQKSDDRTCELLMGDDKPQGLLAFKNSPSSEYAQYGVADSLEVKALFVIDPKENSGKGIGRTLIERAKEHAQKVGATGFHLTASEGVLNFFKKMGFEEKHVWDGKFKPGVKETLFFYQLDTNNESKRNAG